MNKKWVLGGFTLIELLVVIAIIALLISIIVPSLRKAKDGVRRIVCRNDLKQVVISANIYASDYDEWIFLSGDGWWLQDLDVITADLIIEISGGDNRIFYCPSVRDKRGPFWPYWNYTSTYHVTGYFWMMDRMNRDTREHIPRTQMPAGTPPKKWPSKVTCKNPTATELVTDIIFSNGNDPTSRYDWTPAGGLADGDYTNHVDYNSRLPQGSNVGFVDGSVDWRNWEKDWDKVKNNTGNIQHRWWATGDPPITTTEQPWHWW